MGLTYKVLPPTKDNETFVATHDRGIETLALYTSGSFIFHACFCACAFLSSLSSPSSPSLFSHDQRSRKGQYRTIFE